MNSEKHSHTESERAAYEALYADDPLYMACPDCIGGYHRYGDDTASACSTCERTGRVRRETDAYTALIRDLLRDHQRMYPHHADLCELCKRAAAAIAPPVQTEVCPVCRTGHAKPLCPIPADWCEHNVPRRFCTAVHPEETK